MVSKPYPQPSKKAGEWAFLSLSVLCFCLCITALSRGMGETFGVFLLPLSGHFGWERATVTSVYSMYMVSLGIGSLLSGLAFDRYGARFNYSLGIALLTVAYGLAGRLSELWQFYFTVGICAGLGAAMVGIVPTQSIVSRWFDKRLATALSVAYAGQGLGALMMVPLAQLAIVQFEWSGAYRYAGYLFLAVFLIVALLPWERIEQGASNNPRRAVKGKSKGGISLREAVKTTAFWGFFFIFASTAIGIFGISLQTVAYLIERGFSEVESALAFGIVGMLSFAGMTLTGLAADRWPGHIVASVSYALSFIGIAALALLQVYNNWVLLGIFVLTFGLSAGARGPIVTTLMAKTFAGKGLASIYGASNLGQGLGAALGAFGSGLLFDLTAGYNTGFILCTLFTLIGAALFWLVPEIRYAKK